MTDTKIWEHRVAAWRASGQSARAFAEGREFTVHMLRYWARQVGARTPTAAATTALVARPAVRMARVLRTAADVEPAASDQRPVMIEVGRARVAVVAGFDRPTLAAVLELLGAGAGR